MWVFPACTSGSELPPPQQIVHAAEASLQQLHDELDHASASAQLGFPDELDHAAAAAQLGFYEKHGLASADHLRFPMNLRRLQTNGAPSSPSATQVSPSIVVIIIVLTVIFFLSAFLHLLIRWLARNPALIRRGRARNSTGAHSSNRIIALTALQGQLQQLFNIQDAGVERSLIEELPVFSFKAAIGGLKEGADCAICLCEFVGDDQLRLLPLCGHAFHTECIDTWLLSHSTCPLCRALLVPECWIPGMLQPLLSSEISTAGENDRQHIADTIVPALSGRFTGSSRRSSVGHVTVTASTLASPLSEHNLSQLAAEPPSPHVNTRTVIPTRSCTDLAISAGTDSANRASSETGSARGMPNSAGTLAISNPNEIGKMCSASEMENRANQTTKMITHEQTCSANAKSFDASSSAIIATIMDSGRLSYTSLGNQTDAQSETYNDVDGVSAYGSGRRVSVHLGKCRVVREQGKGMRKSKASGDASRRSYSKGSYEYVIDSSSNLEVIIPPITSVNPHSKRLNDLLNLSHRNTTSVLTVVAAEITSSGVHVSRDSPSKNLSPSWASASFRKLRIHDGGEDVDRSIEAMDVPLNTSMRSDKPASIDCWSVVITPELPESSATTSMRANVGSDASFSPEMVNQRLQELMLGSNGVLAEHETSKQAISFRLPTPASHDVMSARLKTSASRRALSESEAFTHWEPTITEQSLDRASNDCRLILNDNTGSHRSSSFAKRTMDWLVGWQKRMVHPDKSAQATSSRNNPS